MSFDADYKFESYERYYGNVDQVRKEMDECKGCGSKLIFSHLPDYKNLLIQETSRCIECGANLKKIIHVLN